MKKHLFTLSLLLLFFCGKPSIYGQDTLKIALINDQEELDASAQEFQQALQEEITTLPWPGPAACTIP